MKKNAFRSFKSTLLSEKGEHGNRVNMEKIDCNDEKYRFLEMFFG